MIRIVLMFSLLSLACCQYPRQRAPPLSHRQPPQGPPLDDDYDYEPHVAPPPVQQRKVLHKPASVHYVNIGAELAGDYKFGYDTGKADNGQSFREETRLPDGTVQGAYGYVDETGKQRIVKYTAGKDGFKVLGDSGSEDSSRSAPSRPALRQTPPPQQAYRPPPQETYRPPAPQQVHRSPHPQQAYNHPPVSRAAPEEEYTPPRAYRAPVVIQRQPESQRPRSHTPRQQYAPEPVHRSRNSQPDYDYPENDIVERRIVPIDTSLFNYNIGTNGK